MDPVEEEHQARRAEKRVQRYVVPALLQNVPPAPVWNRDRGKGRKRFYLASVHVLQNLEDTILDLHRCQLTEQQQRTTKEYGAQITRVEAERQRQENVVQRDREVEVEGQRQVEINQIMEEWRNEDVDALDYEEQQNRGDIGDLNVDKNMQENILRVVSNIFHTLSVDKY